MAGTGRPSWPEFFAKAPLSEAARRDLVRLYGKNPDYLHGKTVEQKLALLARISYQEFLLTHAKMSPDALPFFLGQGGRNNKRVDTTPALEAARAGRIGFDGLGLPDEESFRQGSFTFHFPDGNASIARLLVSRLVPKAIPGTPRHGVDRERAAGGLRPARRRRHADADPLEQHGRPRGGGRARPPARRSPTCAAARCTRCAPRASCSRASTR